MTMHFINTQNENKPEVKGQSATATFVEYAEAFKVSQPRGSEDKRPPVKPEQLELTIVENMHSISEMFTDTNADGLIQNFTYQQVTGLEFILKGVRRRVDDLAMQIKDEVEAGENGNELEDDKLITLQVEVAKLEIQEQHVEIMLDAAETAYYDITGNTYKTPTKSSYRMHTETAATVDGKTWLAGRANKTAAQKIPEGTQIIITGGREFTDVKAEWDILDNILTKYPDMVLLHGGAQGVDRIGAAWAKRKNVPQVEFKPDWNKFGKAAGYRRNETMVRQTKPTAVVAFPGENGTKHCIETALKSGIRVWEPMTAVGV